MTIDDHRWQRIGCGHLGWLLNPLCEDKDWSVQQDLAQIPEDGRVAFDKWPSYGLT